MHKIKFRSIKSFFSPRDENVAPRTGTATDMGRGEGRKEISLTRKINLNEAKKVKHATAKGSLISRLFISQKEAPKWQH